MPPFKDLKNAIDTQCVMLKKPKNRKVFKGLNKNPT
jgi:hypothetical protein